MINPKDAISIIAKRLKTLIDNKELDASYDESDTTLSVYIDDIKLGRIPLLTLRLSDHYVNMHYFYHNRPTNPAETTNLSIEFYTPKTKDGKKIRNRVGHNVTVDNRSHATPFDITYFSYPSKSLVSSDIEPIYQQILNYIKGEKFIDPFLNTYKEAKTDTVYSRFIIKDPRNYVPQNISGYNTDIPLTDTDYGAEYVSESKNNQANKQDTNMKTESRKRNVARLTESKLKQIVAKSIKRVLKEDRDIDGKISNDDFRKAVEYSTDNIPKREESPYEVCYCEWVGDQFPSVEVYNDSMAETEEEKRSDAWCLCEQAENPTISWLWDPENEEIVEMFCSDHFTEV